MSNLPLDHLKRLMPRDAWANEATDFTPWLARQENFAVLADALHFTDAEVEATEHAVGSFSADIIARDRDGYVLIENQLEQTDHTHLGQILTYLAGLDGAVKVVWVSTKVREEHRAAVDWLNAHTPDDFSFFAVELELFQIGSSPAAPHFHVVAKPNEWSRHISGRAKALVEAPMDDRQKRYKEFWTGFSDYLSEHDPQYGNSTPPKDHWWAFGIGRTGFSLTVSAGGRDHWICTDVFFHDDADKLIFGHFFQQRSEIEETFGSELEWERLENRKGSRVSIRVRDVDPMNSEKWPEYYSWFLENMQNFRRSFSKRIRELDMDALAFAQTERQEGGLT